MRFTPSATALEGMTGHAMVTARRAAGYETEVTLSCEFEGLTVRGRADGYDADRNTVEEIKTYRGDLSLMPANRRALHWAQVKVYGWMLCLKRGLAQIDVALVYYDVATQIETVLRERLSADELRLHFEQSCRRYAEWAAQEAAHRSARDEALSAVAFPHADFRAGQRPLSEAVYKAAVTGRCLMAQAPTGIGKTVGTLFPLLKAMPSPGIDKALYLTAKGPGRALALEALHVIGARRAPIRVLELVARDKACEHPGKACHGEACPLAEGFYDRLPAARAEAVERAFMDRTALREVAARHRVCPYYLGQEMVRWSDVITGDYNYWFDTSAMLHGMTMANEWKVGVLVDEAHNLVDRARGMYSADLRRSDLARVIATAPIVVKPSLKRLDRVWNDMESMQIERARIAADRSDPAYAVHDELPDGVANALQQSIAAVADYLAEQHGASAPGPESALLRWHFDALHFARLHDSFGDHSLIELELDSGFESHTRNDDPTSTLRLRNVVPAPFLKPRFAAAHATTLFSATLSPDRYYLDLLGLPEDTVSIDVESPFSADQLRVEIAAHVSTRFDRRTDSLAPIAAIMAAQFEREPGNYLAFFSSFDYLQRVAALFESLHPHVPAWRQTPSMDEAARSAFLQRFTASGRGIAFAVLGGAFGEGIDLAGTRLVGAFIATLGLPPLNAANEQIRARMEATFGVGAGYDYTYLYPGMTKVVQAAGRVIRGPSDRGTIHLIDDRYARADVQALLPRWWKATVVPKRATSKRPLPIR
ncbi:helicase C-terminal domain-containing protein [soil metagenome]